MSGKLIVLEGTDGSGKSTQKKMLTDYLKSKNIDFREVTFPRYHEQSAFLLEKYLNGDFGKNPSDVSAKTASVFYAIDRYTSFQTDWKDYYNEGGIIICDRYTTSNAVHQTAKLKEDEWIDFTQWLFDFEYNIMSIPKPDLVLFLNMPTDSALKLIDDRQGDTGDIHEKDHNYLRHCYECALKICKEYNWQSINCVDGDKILSKETINQNILKVVLKEMQG